MRASRSRGASRARRRWLVLFAVLVAGLLAGCSGGDNDSAPAVFTPSGVTSTPQSGGDPSPTTTRVAEPTAVLGSDGRAVPRPDRPVVHLNFDLTNWRSGTATGTEDVTFTPDLRVCELVFRLWPNTPKSAGFGNLLTVTKATIDGKPVRPQLQPAGGKANLPTLLQLPLTSCVKPGRAITTHLEFGLKIGTDGPERIGRATDNSYAWLGSAYPLLAWEHGAGWMRDPAVDVTGEMAGSEDYNLKSLDITAPRDDQVQGVGQSVQHSHPYSAAAQYRFTAPAVRDVLITVGDFAVRTEQVGDITLHLATHDGMQANHWLWLAAAEKSLKRLPTLLGPFPYDDVWLTVTDTQLTGGLEYPGAALLGDTRSDGLQTVLTRELAHSYFYGLAGNDQGRDPWLDEALASWAEIVVDHQPAPAPPPDAPDGKVGQPMGYWAQQPDSDRTYLESVSGWGSLGLIAARQAVGAKAFDAAIRQYLNQNAHRIARPEDFAAAFTKLPAVLTILRNSGALPS